MENNFTYDVAFTFNLFKGKGNISGKQGTIEIFSDKPIDIEEMKTSKELNAMISADVQSQYKRANLFGLTITNIHSNDKG